MPGIEDIVCRMRANPRDVRFRDALRVRGSHHFFSMPWRGSPLVNLQEGGGTAKAYQIRQLLAAVDRLERERHA